MTDPLAPFFLGAYGENNDFFEKTLLELVRDHVFWRRNFHPEDEPPIGTHDQYSRAYLDGLATTRHELHQLTAALKRSVPSFHPRYLGHMTSDLLLPGLIAQLVTTLYNPNNIVEDVAPITIQLELEVGRQLARMLGLNVDPKHGPCALGHLTSGGTVANDEALWLARSARLFPLALRDGVRGHRPLDPGPSGAGGQYRRKSCSRLARTRCSRSPAARPASALASRAGASCSRRSPRRGSRSSDSLPSLNVIPR
jgi:hypothetical protein